jgi:hypothetical protein
MDAAELVELLAHLRNAGRASAYDAIAAFAEALKALPDDFATQLQREADARVASGGALAALPKRDLRGLDVREADRDRVVLVLEDTNEATCTATLKPDLAHFASGAAAKPFLDDVILEDTIVLDPGRFASKSVRDLGIKASITIVSTAKRSKGTAFDEVHDGTIATEFKLIWNVRGDELRPRPALADPAEDASTSVENALPGAAENALPGAAIALGTTAIATSATHAEAFEPEENAATKAYEEAAAAEEETEDMY